MAPRTKKPAATLTPDEVRLEAEKLKTERQRLRSQNRFKPPVLPPPGQSPAEIALDRGKVVKDDEAAEILSSIARGDFDARAADRNAALKVLLTPSARLQERMVEEFTAILAEAASAVAIKRADPSIASDILKAFRAGLDASQEASHKSEE